MALRFLGKDPDSLHGDSPPSGTMAIRMFCKDGG